MAVSVAVCGITGVVGQEVIHCLKALDVQFGELALFASARSAGVEMETSFGKKIVEEFCVERVREYDFVFLCVGGEFSLQYAWELTKKGAVVIDNSSAFRRDDDVPLIIPEVNPGDIGDAKLIANPNCTTAILAVALFPIYKKFGLKRVIVSTYQATSGAGKAAMDELSEQMRNYLDYKPVVNTHFAHPIPFNIIPQIDVFQENLYTKEEMKVVWETRRTFGEPDLKISCTAVRIPTFRAHAEAVTVETERPVCVKEVRKILEAAKGVEVVDDPASLEYPMPLTATKKFDVEVGRIRGNDVFGDCGLDFFVCGDQLLKGAALNAVEIMRIVVDGK